MRLPKCLRNDAISNLEDLGFQVGPSDVLPLGRHVGVLIRKRGDPEVRFCHLAWHHILRITDPMDSILWVQSPLDQANRHLIVAYLYALAANSANVPYGLDTKFDCFDPATGAYRPQAVGKGLTCASFVIAVFETIGHPLTLDEWPRDRFGDAEWGEDVIKALAKYASEEHLTAMKADLGAARHRPEEVAVCGATVEPTTFAEAERTGLEVLEVINSIRKQPSCL